MPTQAVYTATKAAIESMSQCLAVEAAKWNIRVNCIAPGAIDTPMNKGLQGERRKNLSQRIPLGRVGLSSDMVGAALFSLLHYVIISLDLRLPLMGDLL